MLPKAQGAKKRRYLSLTARISVASAAILWVLHGQDWRELTAVFQRLNLWYFALSLATFTAAQFVIAVRWWLLLRAQAIHIALRAALRLHFLGLFYNNVMPGSVGGDLLKAWYVTKHTDKRLEGALSVVVDRAVGLAGLLLMGTIAYLAFVRGRLTPAEAARDGGMGRWLLAHKAPIVGATLGVVGVLALVLIHPNTRVRLRPLAGRIVLWAAVALRRVKEAIVVYCSKPLTILWALLLTFVAQSTVITAFWLLGRNLAIDAGAKYYFVIFPVMWVVAAMPISVAGLGVLEAGIVELFTRLVGTAAEEALALAFCQRLVWVLASLPGGIIHLLGAHLPRDIFVDAENRLN